MSSPHPLKGGDATRQGRGLCTTQLKNQHNNAIIHLSKNKNTSFTAYLRCFSDFASYGKKEKG
jgi:hypothetical protein